MKRKTKALWSIICSTSFLCTLSLPALASTDMSQQGGHASAKTQIAHRFQGQDRFETSMSIANELEQDQQVQNIVLASGYSFPDALAASTLAYQLKAPIILAGHGFEDSQETLNYVKEHLLAGGTVTIVGGHGVVSKQIEQWLTANNYKVDRLGGKDRFETDELIVNQLNVAQGTPVILAPADNFPDALGISSLAASKGFPILLSNPGNLPQTVQDFLTKDKPTTVYIVGGEGVMRPSVIDQIKTLAPNTNVVRFGGEDRFGTLAQILNTFYPNPTQIYVANGYEFADALAGSPLAASKNAPILLVDPNGNHLPQSITDYLNMLRKNNVTPQVNVLGGEGAVPQRLIDQINEILQGTGESTATTVSSAVTTDSQHITLTLSSALTGTIGDPAAFTIAGVASNPVVTNVAVNETKVTLTLSTSVMTTDSAIKVSYTKTGSNDLTNGAPVDNFSLIAVTNNVQ
ncbi:cell wall-binding repeat-containing protein [Desulfitobacterium sp.]|uniref:cell wall-binding repeat-containing protein n=1 Tax=Desulfitobacterium sp. TaxID=49981 RepID=UPI002C1B7B2E|nr:cell wall-binding repeat-containing protein [Desulfitobacterium sp.]HVJ50518.1 cell wall-binding repeat-containing protein [Desulfitobacterium sp.]